LKIILGLGNPGPRYERTRHNAGFLAVDRLAKELGVAFRRKEGIADVASAKAFGEDLVLAKPLTFMNLSGEAASRLSGKHGAAPADFLMVYDDVALPLGRIRVRPGGSSAGHRGVQSVIDHLGTQEIPRVRLGILGPPPAPGTRRILKQYVLEEFGTGEKAELELMIERAAEAVSFVIERGLPFAANRFNRDAGENAEGAPAGA
jgi:PTH1 family peptidyl-tRNA hydrolase